MNLTVSERGGDDDVGFPKVVKYINSGKLSIAG